MHLKLFWSQMPVLSRLQGVLTWKINEWITTLPRFSRQGLMNFLYVSIYDDQILIRFSKHWAKKRQKIIEHNIKSRKQIVIIFKMKLMY